MLRMEIALFSILFFVAYMYFGAEKQRSLLHRTFSLILIVVLVHLVFDTITIYTVNHLDSIPVPLNDIFHRLFIGSMVLVIFLFYLYIAILVEESTGRPRKLDVIAKIFLALSELGCLLLPIQYIETPRGNYSAGLYVVMCYASVVFYLSLCVYLLLKNRKQIDKKQRFAIGAALFFECSACITQAVHHDWLISGIGITLMTLSFYLTLENPDILRSELTEQKLSMLYLKSQVNPHFLYNTLDTIRIQAQLNGDKEAAHLLMRLSDFFRLSIKADKSRVSLDDELELLEAYMELMCYRYPQLQCEYDIDPDLGGTIVPNFILQPLVENSLLHGLKNKGYRGTVTISAAKAETDCVEICIRDTGCGFPEEKKKSIAEMLTHYDKQPPKLTGNSIGILNVQKRIKLLCGNAYGLRYTDNPDGGVTAHILLPRKDCE